GGVGGGGRRETSSAPRVNQMRFFSSSALASAPKLRFAASCSAAETMFRLSPAAPHASSPSGYRQTPDIIWCSASISPSLYLLNARDRRGKGHDVMPPH